MPLRLNYLATESGFEIVRVARFFEAPADVGDDFKTLGRGAPLAAMGLKETVTAPLVHVVEANTKPCTGYPHLNDVREVLLSMAGIVVNFAAFIRSPTDQCLSGAMWSTANRVSGLAASPGAAGFHNFPPTGTVLTRAIFRQAMNLSFMAGRRTL